MNNDTLLQILDELKDIAKNGGIIKVNGNGGISAYSIPDSNKDNQAENSLQNILDELTKSGKALDKQYKEIKDNECKPDLYDADYDSTNDDEDGTDGDYFDEYDPEIYEPDGYDPEGVTETDIDELINKLSDEQQALKDKLNRLGKALAEPSTIGRVGKEQYHLMAMQYNAMVNYRNIITERINLLNYDSNNDLDQD